MGATRGAPMIGRLRRVYRLRRLSEEFGRRLGDPAAYVDGSLIGLEHEYLIRRRVDGKRVNFAQLIRRLAPSQRGLEPADANAYWLPSGTIITADETEAELALSPTAARPGFTTVLGRRVAAAEGWLSAALPAAYVLGDGVSSHFSVAVRRGLEAALAERYARSWAPAMMLLLDDRNSPGILVRPRPGRLELCGEFARGDDLRTAALFALGSTLAVISSLEGRGPKPAPLDLRLRMGDQRYGWYVDRAAGGSDLYEVGRDARFRTESGAIVSAQRHLAAAWSLARPWLRRHAQPDELALVDDLVDGTRPLRIERRDDSGGLPAVVAAEADAQAALEPATAFGRALGPRSRLSFDLAPVMVTWQVAVFVIARRADYRRAFAVVPGRLLGRFLKRLERGLLDVVIEDYLEASTGGRRMSARPHDDRAALYDALHVRPALLAVERPLLRPGLAA